MQASRFRYGNKRAGSGKMIHVGGSNGTVATTWDDGLRMTNAKFDDGKRSNGTSHKSRNTVVQAIQTVIANNDKLCFTGRMTVENFDQRTRSMTNDSQRTYWFRAKSYGWGWVPATWQGWVILIAFIALIVGNVYRIDSRSHSASDTLIQAVPESIFLILILIGICWRTGERPQWRWGKR
jgi:hypothetical protein